MAPSFDRLADEDEHYEEEDEEEEEDDEDDEIDFSGACLCAVRDPL